MNTPDVLAEKEQLSVKNTEVSFDEAGEKQKRDEIALEKQKNKEEQNVQVGELKKKLDEAKPGPASDNKEIGIKDIKTETAEEGKRTGRQKFKDRFKWKPVNFNINPRKKTSWDVNSEKGDQKNNLAENTPYKDVFEEIIQKLVNGEGIIKDDKYYEAMQRGFNQGINHRKGDAIIKIFNTLLENKGYEIIEANHKDFKMTIKGAAAYYKLVNKQTGTERKITITPSNEPIVFEK